MPEEELMSSPVEANISKPAVTSVDTDGDGVPDSSVQPDNQAPNIPTPEVQQAAREQEQKRLKEQQEKQLATANRVRLNEQAGLMLNIQSLLEQKASGDNQPRKEKTYNNFSIFRGEGVNGHIELTNYLYKNPDLLTFFTESDTSFLSYLMPTIKLYKLFYPVQEAVKSPQNDCFIWRIPIDDIPVDYNDRTSDFLKSASKTGIVESNSQGTLDELLNGQGRLHGVGIKSFNFVYKGTNPAEVNTYIEAELELVFQDIRDLIKIIKIDKQDPNFIYTGANPTRDYTFCYADLVADSTRSEMDKKTRNPIPNPEYFRIQAEIGYAEPTENFWELYENVNKLTNDDEIKRQEKINKFKSAIRSSKVILYLNPYSHDLQFQENGTVIIKIQYNAAITSTLANINVLAITPQHQKIRDLEKKVDSIKINQNREIDTIKKNCGRVSEDELANELKKTNTKAEAELKAEQEKLDNEYNKVYSEIFKRLVGLQNNKGQNNGKVYSVLLNKSALGINLNQSSNTPDEKSAEQIRIENLADSKNIDSYKVDSITENDPDVELASKPKEIKKADVSTNSEADSAAQDANVQITRTTVNMLDETKILVKFVYLGDVLDILSETIEELGPIEKPRIILNEFNIDIPKALTGDFKKTTNGNWSDFVLYDDYKLNIADVPITINNLQKFFLDNIIKNRPKHYSLQDLIVKLITEIVAPSISPKVFGKKSVFNKIVRMSTMTLSLPFLGDTVDAITGASIDSSFSGILQLEKIKSRDIPRSVDMNTKFGNYLILYASSRMPTIIAKNGGTLEKDKELGIYHFFVGSDRGLMKKITFSKTNMPFYKEAKQFGTAGNKSILRLREVYDCNITMFGNNIFKPGDHVYINPLFFSGDIAVDIENKLGIGGYYQVIDVTNSIQNNVFETSMKCVFVAHIERETGEVTEDVGEEC